MERAIRSSSFHMGTSSSSEERANKKELLPHPGTEYLECGA